MNIDYSAVLLTVKPSQGGNMARLTMAIGLAFIVVGLVGVATPSLVLEFGASLLTPTALYAVAALRIAIGIVLVRVAPESRHPTVFRVVGILIIIAGVLTPLFGVDRSRAVFEWWSSQGPLAVRLGAGVAVVFGIFLIHAIVSPRRAAG